MLLWVLKMTTQNYPHIWIRKRIRSILQKTKNKRRKGSIQQMSPDEYVKKAAAGFNVSV